MAAIFVGVGITIGWTGLAIGSWMIGAITANDDLHLKNSLLVLPGGSVLVVLIGLLRRMVTRTGGWYQGRLRRA